MKKILISLSIMGAVAAVVVGATTAFFSDTETSTGNTFTAGAIDLKIDNTSYLNGVLQDGRNETANTTWQLSDLTGQLFFDFADLKPGDWGEDTISLHVFSNDAWACMNIQQTADRDVTCNDPENEAEGYDITGNPICGSGNANTNGELGSELNFIFWADDGDNVLEIDEPIIRGPDKADELFNGESQWTLADSDLNVWSDDSDDPIVGSNDYFIAKAWCYGNISSSQLEQDGLGDLWNPAMDNDNDGDVDSADGGFLCDGSDVGNASQTDQKTADVFFTAEQSRNNDDFTCDQLND